MTGIAALVSVGTGFDLQNVAAYDVAGISGDLCAVTERSAVFFNFIHIVSPPDILL
jgi:hypothetical protein